MPRPQTIAKTGAHEVQVRGTKREKKSNCCCHLLSRGTDAEIYDDIQRKTAHSIESVTKRSNIVIGYQKKGWMGPQMDQGGPLEAHQEAALSLGV